MKRLGLFILFFLFLSRNCTFAHEPNDTLTKAVNLYHQGSYETALEVLTSCLKDAEAAKDTQCLILIHRNFGNAYSRLGKAVESLVSYQESVRLAEEYGDIRAAGRSLMNVGAFYEEQKNLERALSIYEQVETLIAPTGDSSILADCANNKGIIYEQQGNYQRALNQYNKALRIYELIGNEERIGLALNNIGIVYKFLGDYKSSIHYYQRALKLAEKNGNRFQAAANLTNMGNVYFLMKDYAQSAAHHLKSLKIAREIDALLIIVETYVSLAELYAARGDYKNAYLYHQRYVQVHDSLLNKERLQQIAELETKYETEKKEKEIAVLKQARDLQVLQLNTQYLLLQRRNLQILAICISVVLGGIIAFLFYSRQQLKQKQLREKAVIDTEIRERIRIARDMHDDLGSGLSRISLVAELAGRKTLTDQGAHDDIRYIARVSKELVDNMRDLVWILNPEHASLSHLAARIREFCSDYLEQSNIAVHFDMDDNLPDFAISRELQRNVFLTVKEAVHNIVKHSGARNVHLSFHADSNALRVKISDDGRGFEPDVVRSSSNGLRNMRQRIETLGGSYQLASSNLGTTIEIIVSFSEKGLIRDRNYLGE